MHWAKLLEQAGCLVIYGMNNLKTHSKITLVVRRRQGKIERFVHLGTGNYNDATAKMYTDMAIITSNKEFGVDAKKPDYLPMSKSEFTFEFSSKITSEDTPEYEFLYYEAKKVSDSPLAIEYTFEPRDYIAYHMIPHLHFYIKQNDENYRPKSVEILEVVGMKENHLYSKDGGRMRAVLTFEGVDPSKEFYFVYDNYYQTVRGYAIRFDN